VGITITVVEFTAGEISIVEIIAGKISLAKIIRISSSDLLHSTRISSSDLLHSTRISSRDLLHSTWISSSNSESTPDNENSSQNNLVSSKIKAGKTALFRATKITHKNGPFQGHSNTQKLSREL